MAVCAVEDSLKWRSGKAKKIKMCLCGEMGYCIIVL